jgi:hypothetical protein
MSRDRRVLPWIGEQYAARLDQVQVLLGRDVDPSLSSSAISLSAALQVVRRWTELGLVEYRRMVHGEPGWVWLTHHGLGELGLTYTKYVPKLSALPHLYLVNRLRLVHEQRNPLYPWKSERTLRTELPRRAAGVSVVHLPDGVILDPNGSIALEVELTVKSQERLIAILQSLLEEPAEDDRPKYARIWYFASAAARPHVERALLDLEEDQRERVRVYALETLQSK